MTTVTDQAGTAHRTHPLTGYSAAVLDNQTAFSRWKPRHLQVVRFDHASGTAPGGLPGDPPDGGAGGGGGRGTDRLRSCR